MSTRKVMPILVVFAMLVGLLGFAMPVFAAAGDIVVSYTLPSGQLAANQTFSVPVKIAVTSAQDLTGASFDMTWDSSVVNLTSVTKGDFFLNCTAASGGDYYHPATIVNPTTSPFAGKMTLLALAGLGVPTSGPACFNTGSGATSTGTTLVTLNFTAKANGKSNFAIQNILFVKADGNNTWPLYTFPGFALRVGPAPLLAVQSVVFTPASGNMTTSVTVTIVNNGAAMSVPADDTVVTLSMNNAAPASQTFPVSGLGAGATTSLTQAYTLTTGQTSTHLIVTDSIYGLNQGSDYFASITSLPKPVIVDATVTTSIDLSTTGNINFHPLNLGDNSANGTLTVTSNAQGYQVNVSADNWNMKEWNGTAYVAVSGAHPYTLHDKLNINAYEGSTFLKDVTADGQFFTGTVQGQTADAGETFGLVYTQKLHTNDASVAPNSYHAVVTYQSAVSF